ncbi:MAG TPA: cytochrome c biogenesis protein CcdA, partial [Chitinophagales bacterium]|nr:cytochrome c biogenesis protein CcdA [Chitinophagales bacterium]
MKKISSPFLFLLPVMLLLAPAFSFAQILDPVKWSFGQKKVKDNVYDLTFTATIESGWHIFPQTLPADATPLPTEFRFDEVKGCKLEGKVKESGEVHMTKDFPDTTLTYKTYEKKAVFTQRVVLEEGQGIVKGSLTFMTCKEVCLPPKDEEFSFVIQGNIESTPEGTQPDTTGMVQPSNTDVRADNSTEAIDTAAVAAAEKEALLKTTAEQEKAMEDKQSLKDKSLWRIFLIGFGAGAFSLITPCVYSMIPLTVTFFTKQKGDRKKGIGQALMYAFSIVVIFVMIGVILYMFNVSSDSVNEFASNGVFNFALFLLFMVFAVSFFGVFEITLPTAWINKSENMSDKGGLMGIFFMAFTLVLVSFSCTAPFVGSALALITQGHAAGPIVGMFAYSLAFALPFGLFAFFPNWLQSLPKSGGWLNVIKVTFAFVELALALKFLSNVDLAYHWRFLDRDIFLTLWIIIFALLGLYLLGFIRFSHDTPMEHLSIPRLLFA